MTGADDDFDPIDIDEEHYEDPDVEGTEIEEFRPDSVVVQHTQAAVRKRVLARYAGQLNTIDLAKAVRDELSPLTASAERGAILEAAVVKLGLDILAENVKPKSVREAAQAIETLARIQGLSQGEVARMPPGVRMDIFARVTSELERTTGDINKLPPTTREAIEAVVSDED